MCVNAQVMCIIIIPNTFSLTLTVISYEGFPNVPSVYLKKLFHSLKEQERVICFLSLILK